MPESAGDKDTLGTRWERVAITTKWGAYVSETEKRAIDTARSLFESASTALEIGAEGGRWSELLAKAGWTMTCTDIDAGSLAVCKKRIPEATCVLVQPGDSCLPCESGSMDLILCIEVPHVLQMEWFSDEVSRVLRGGGRLVGVFNNRTSPRGWLLHTRSSLNGSFDFYELSYAPWRRDLISRGYTIRHEEGFCWAPFSRESNSPLVPSFVRAEKWLGLRRLVRFSPWIAFIAEKQRPLDAPECAPDAELARDDSQR